MANNQIFSEEVLITICKDLSEKDLNQCQRVCRSWYKTVHLQFLQSISIVGTTQIEQFINSFDLNRNPAYFNAVKSISVRGKSWLSNNTEEAPIQFDKAKIRKLLFRFPNVEKIHIDGLPTIYESFDTRLCSELLKKCTKLTSFSTDPSDIDACYKFRKLVTEIDLYEDQYFDNYGGVTKFLSSFPRLKGFSCHIKEYDTFKKLLPVFEKVPNITKVSVSEALYDEGLFGDDFIKRRKEDKQEIIKQRLANVTELRVDYKEEFCEWSMYFICKYFKGLKTFQMDCVRNYAWNPLAIRFFCNEIMDFICPLEDKNVSCEQIGLGILAQCLPSVFKKVLDQYATPDKKKTFKLTIRDDGYSPADSGKLDISGSQYLNVSVSKDLSLNRILSKVFATSTPINLVDNFILDFDYSGFGMGGGGDFIGSDYGSDTYDESMYEELKVNVEMYDKFLQMMPSLKKVKLEIHSSFTENASVEVSCETSHPLVKILTLEPAEKVKYQSMLNWCFSAFPNLEQLNIHLSSGIWNQDSRQFQLDLSKYTLTKLSVDMTPVRDKTIKDLKKENLAESFFVLQVKTLDNNEQNLYRIGMNFSS